MQFKKAVEEYEQSHGNKIRASNPRTRKRERSGKERVRFWGKTKGFLFIRGIRAVCGLVFFFFFFFFFFFSSSNSSIPRRILGLILEDYSAFFFYYFFNFLIFGSGFLFLNFNFNFYFSGCRLAACYVALASFAGSERYF